MRYVRWYLPSGCRKHGKGWEGWKCEIHVPGINHQIVGNLRGAGRGRYVRYLVLTIRLQETWEGRRGVDMSDTWYCIGFTNYRIIYIVIISL